MSDIAPQQTTLGFIGTGVMGKSMARHLLDAGYRLHVYTRTKAKAQDLLAAGASWAESPAAVAEACDVIFTIVGFPADVEEVYLGGDGLVAHMKDDAVLVDMTTSSPELAVKIAEAAEARGGSSLDAPVSGGDSGAKAGKLSIMVGGPEATFARIKPLFDLMGQNIVHQGPAGSGQHTKMCNQIAIANNMVGVCEAIAYARRAGLDPQTVLKSIESGAAGSWSLSNLAPRIVGGDFEPGFYIKHFIKDMTIADDAAAAMGLDAEGLKLAKRLYERLAEQGHGDRGTQALYKRYEQN